MNCPNCNTPSHSKYKELLANVYNPMLCLVCGSKFYVRRVLSGLFLYGFIESGVIFIALLLSFGKWGGWGVLSLISFSYLLWLVLAMIEAKTFPVYELTESLEKRRNWFTVLMPLIVFFVIVLIAVTI